MEEQEELGSYCLDCWEVVNKYQECTDCKVSLYKERLYVSTDKEKPPRCQKCYCLNLNSSVSVDDSTIQKSIIKED
jgi:NAD-dependent SIR2 family protein deacetylase